MPARLPATLVLAAAMVHACGPRPRATERQDSRAVSGPAIASSLEVTVAGDVAFALHVTNNASRRLELTFPTGQTHEIVVLDTLGREVWRWSAGRMFTQALQNRVLESSETVTYQATWKTVPPAGTFVAVASLASRNQPLQQRVEFTVP
jgi:hypothetical protein